MSSPEFRKLRHHTRLPAVTPGMAARMESPSPQHSPLSLCLIGYGPAGCEEITLAKVEDIDAFAAKWPVVWIDVDGLGNTALNLALGKKFALDALMLEDIFDVNHAPKIEEYDQSVFLLLKNGMRGEGFQTEQISLVLMEKFIITFQERPGDSFNHVRERIRKAAGRIRQFGSDYLAYALIDAVIESYYPILEALKTRLDAIEDIFTEAPARLVMRQIHDIKNELLFLHSAVWPIYNITLTLAHDDMPVVTQATEHYLRDCQDQAKRVTELSEFYRLIAGDLMSTSLAFLDNKANEVMKVLTMVATIFIPLSFLASLYGMNFDRTVSPYNMPELGTRYGYPVLLAVMLVIAGSLLFMFWRKGWFGMAASSRK